MSTEYEEQDVYVLLDFQGKDTTKFFKQQSVYFRMLNLHESKPVVEIGGEVYEGIYDDAVGTNVFFEEIEDPPPHTDIFEGTTPITLSHLLTQTKVLKMKKIGTKPKPMVNAGPTETVNIHIKDDYRVLLEKYENDNLNIEECVTEEVVVDTKSEGESSSQQSEDSDEEEDQEDQTEVKSRWKASQLPPRQNLKPEWFTSVMMNSSNETKVKKGQNLGSQINPTYMKYSKLQKLAEQPVYRKKIPDIESDEIEQPLNIPHKNNFFVWKNLVMQKIEQQTINLDVNKDKLGDFVDIDKSIEAGIIAPSNEKSRVFTKEEKQELLNFKNFINVSPLMKLMMLQDFIHLEKASLQYMSQKELNEVGTDGCTAISRLELLKNFKAELESHIISRIQDVQTSDEVCEKFEDFKLDISDDDEISDTDGSYSSDENYNEEEEDDGHSSDSKGDEEEEEISDVSDSEKNKKLHVDDENSSASDGNTTNVK